MVKRPGWSADAVLRPPRPGDTNQYGHWEEPMREAVVTEETCIDVNCPTCNPRRSSASGVTEPMTDARLEEIRRVATYASTRLDREKALKDCVIEVDRLRACWDEEEWAVSIGGQEVAPGDVLVGVAPDHLAKLEAVAEAVSAGGHPGCAKCDRLRSLALAALEETDV